MRGVLGTLAASALVAAGCGGGGGPSGSSGAPTPILSAVIVDGGEMYFDPNELHFIVGRPVTVTLRNVGRLTHDFWTDAPVRDLSASDDRTATERDADVDAGIVHVEAMSGHDAVAHFTPTKAGTYPLRCTIPGHAEAGMVGTIVVQPSG